MRIMVLAIAAAALSAAPAAAADGRFVRINKAGAVSARAPAALPRIWRGPAVVARSDAGDGEGRAFLRSPGDPYGSFIGWPGGRIDGDGVAFLDSWLRDTREGQAFVTWNFDEDRNGILGRRDAQFANEAFAQLADMDGDGRLTEREIDRGLDLVRP